MMYETLARQYNNLPFVWIEVEKGKYIAYQVSNRKTLQNIEEETLDRIYRRNKVYAAVGVRLEKVNIANIHSRYVLLAEDYATLEKLGELREILPYEDIRTIRYLLQARTGQIEKECFESFILAFPGCLYGDSNQLLNWAAQLGFMLYENNFYDYENYYNNIAEFKLKLSRLCRSFSHNTDCYQMTYQTYLNFKPALPGSKTSRNSSDFSVPFSYDPFKKRKSQDKNFTPASRVMPIPKKKLKRPDDCAENKEKNGSYFIESPVNNNLPVSNHIEKNNTIASSISASMSSNDNASWDNLLGSNQDVSADLLNDPQNNPAIPRGSVADSVPTDPDAELEKTLWEIDVNVSRGLGIPSDPCPKLLDKTRNQKPTISPQHNPYHFWQDNGDKAIWSAKVLSDENTLEEQFYAELDSQTVLPSDDFFINNIKK